jgi:thiol-disulfide isomerase/thioredoxin
MDRKQFGRFAQLILALLLVSLSPIKGEATNHSGAAEIQRLFLRLRISTLKEAPPLEGMALDSRGEEKELSSFRGNVAFLTFWTTWCPSCKVEMPALQKLYERHRDRGFLVLAVNIQESPEKVAEYFRAKGLSYTPLLDPRGQMARGLGVWSVPTTFILDRRGVVLGKVMGAREWDSPEGHKLLELLLTNK